MSARDARDSLSRDSVTVAEIKPPAPATGLESPKPAEQPASGGPGLRHRLQRFSRSFLLKLVTLVAIFFAVPVVIYGVLRTADSDQNRLLLQSIDAQGRLVAAALRPQVQDMSSASMRAAQQMVRDLGAVGPDIKLLVRPAKDTASSFFYVASSVDQPAAYLEQERRELVDSGILKQFATSCADNQTDVTRFTNPAGGRELLTSVTPINSASGCWVVITATATAGYLGSSLGRGYWQTPAVELALAIYIAMAVLVSVLYLQAGLSLRRFGRLARHIGSGVEQRGSFASLNRVPELAGVAEAFDSLVASLRSSAKALRVAAQEVAHAFKTPLGIVMLSIESVRRAVPKTDPKAQRALELIDRSLERLDHLINAARELDETIAEGLNPARTLVPISALANQVIDDYAAAHDQSKLAFVRSIEPGLKVWGVVNLIEIALQNLIDNAVSFAPLESEIEIGAAAAGKIVRMTVSDRGPGVEPENLPFIFERFVSMRPRSGRTTTEESATSHFGLGLWIARRNVEAMGGTVQAKNRPGGGLEVIITFVGIR
jgi:two-component system sensor histidine kinase ChvG